LLSTGSINTHRFKRKLNNSLKLLKKVLKKSSTKRMTLKMLKKNPLMKNLTMKLLVNNT
jgi:hypothetical protein